MIISVASGKGGTGKTTVATNLARSIGEGVQLLDCDVEEPNAHLFMQPAIAYQEGVHTMIPEVDVLRCSGCGMCMEICRFRAITVVADKALTFPDLCHGCGGCVEICPEQAITEGRRELGTVESGDSDGVICVQGRLRIGEAMSPPLIRKVRELLPVTDTAIIDAPPGTSCPVIAAMRGADFILMVTEPTPFGLHDLQLAVEAVKVLSIPCGMVINRADLGNRNVYEYAHRESIPILLEIPFARNVAEAYSEGRLLVDLMPEWREKFIKMYRKISILAAC